MNGKTESGSLRKKGWTYLLLTVVLVGVAALTILFINNVYGQGQSLNLSFFTPASLTGLFSLLLVYFCFDSLRFYFVLRTLGHKLPFPYIVKLSFINVFVSTITPFATGGGFAQIYFLTKAKVPLGRATAATSIRTLLSVVFFMFALPIVLTVNPALVTILLKGGFLWLLILTAVIYIVIVAALFRVVANERWVRRLALRLLRALRRRKMITPPTARKGFLAVSREVRHFNAGIRLFLGGSKKFLALSVLCTGLFLFTMFSFTVLLVWAMGADIPPGFIYQMQILINFIMYFALTPGATMIAEFGFALMVAGKIGAESITSLTLLWRFFTVYAGTLIGMVSFYWELFAMAHKKKEDAYGR
ncbi:MAG: flippase-like domain-containing protein [Oscillospiraceae bacterium]|jgi:uncharacterized protein (TIRG00374 family)|nr:flippase-like domain-containing protein [Oscillospiraceae bacterium]